MNSYLSPSIEQVLPLLAQTCDDLTKQVLIRELTRHTEELCKGDPELAEILLEGKKTLQECVRYVLEKAATVVVKNIDAMTEKEFKSFGTQQVRGRKAGMAGAAVGSDDAFKWADEYYYGGPSVTPSNVKPATEKKNESKDKKQSSGKKAAAGNGTQAPADTVKAKDKGAMDGGTQISLDGFTKPASDAPAA